jgi:hypothetical protein
MRTTYSRSSDPGSASHTAVVGRFRCQLLDERIGDLALFDPSIPPIFRIVGLHLESVHEVLTIAKAG